ncbi:MAG: phosphoglycerate dehydrogenase [Bacteroidetes bacterium]|nr:phosphoglycerate dehydrogenase [Bacteroidota bacterium]
MVNKNKGTILVTPRSLSLNGHPLLDILTEAGYEVLMPYPGKQPTPAELKESLPGCVGYLAGVEKISAELLSLCPDLKVISRNGVGIENVHMDAAKDLGIAVEITRGANSRGVAELAIGLMFSLLRNIPAANNSIKSGGWERKLGIELSGRTMGILGTGQIGQHTARLASALGMNILAYDLYPMHQLEKQISSFKYAPVQDVLRKSDVVTLHCPAGEKPLLDETELALMKQGCYIINTARAALVDQQAMLSALVSGKIAGYAVDAFASEPPELTPLLKHPNVILTAHIGGFTEESVHRATKAAIENLLKVLENYGT